MGTVLTLGATDIQVHPASIGECHINLWILPAFLGRRYSFDVGFFLMNEHTAQLDRLQLIVPMASPETPQCLVSYMEDKATDSWRAVFGQRPPPPGSRIRTRLARANLEGLRMHSCWDVTLIPPIHPRSEGYLRVRFSSYERPACLDTFGGWFGLGARLRLDLRLFDYHELADFQGLPQDFDRRLIPINNSYVYLVAPHVNRPELYSPPLGYIRILEDPLWRGYLGRKPSLVRRQNRKMHVFAWKRDSANGRVNSPHRIFASLIPRGLLSTVTRAVGVASAGIALSALAFALLFPLLASTAPSQSPQALGPPVVTSLRVSLVTGIIALALSLPRLVGWISTWMRWLQTIHRRIDERLYAVHH